MSRIAATQLSFPDHRHAQAEITEALIAAMPGCDPSMMRRIHQATGVSQRNIALPLESYARINNFTETNNLWMEESLRLATNAGKAALDEAGVDPSDVDVLLFISVTGISAPSLDAKLITTLGLRPDVKRLPSFGLGCVAGAAGIARMDDLLSGRNKTGLLIASELCSLTVQRDDLSAANMVATGLFGDGVAAVVMTQDELGKIAPHVIDSSSVVIPDTTDVLGWDVGSFGFRIVLSASLSDLVEANIANQVDQLLEGNGLSRTDVSTWIAHTGGPKVIRAIENALDLDDNALLHTHRSLAERGNLSSVSVLDALRRTLDDSHEPGEISVLMGMGPGFSSECVLLRWQ
jgi:alkylresorcinol/alkylpyrone synthase